MSDGRYGKSVICGAVLSGVQRTATCSASDPPPRHCTAVHAKGSYMFKFILPVAAASLLACSAAWAAPNLSPSNAKHLSTTGVVQIQKERRKARPRARSRPNVRTRSRARARVGTRSRYTAGRRYRTAPRGYRRYNTRPRDWRTRNCILVGPLWFCP